MSERRNPRDSSDLVWIMPFMMTLAFSLMFFASQVISYA